VWTSSSTDLTDPAGIRIGAPSRGLVSRVRYRWNAAGPLVGMPTSEWPVALRRLRSFGFALFGLQFLAFCVWSAVLVHRVALTHDFITYEQAFYLISHGHLNPFSTTLGYPFWQDHGSFLLWPLAFVNVLWPHPTTLLWLQDAATVGAEAVAFLWICELASARAPRLGDQRPVWLAVCLALLLLVVNPWITWTISSDFHTEPIATLFLIATARDLFAGRRRMWLWLVLALLMGDVGASCCGALGVSAMIAGRRWWRTGLAVAVVGFGWMVVLGAIHATKGTVPSYFAPLILGHPGSLPATTSALTIAKAIILHPGRAADAFWANRLNVWANISSFGLLGLVWAPAFLPVLLVLLEGALTYGPQSSLPGFQNFPLLVLGVIGTVAICLRLAQSSRLRRGTLPALILVLAANGIGWAAVWLPRISGTWLPVSPAAAGTLRQLSSRIGSADEVVVQQGVSTVFSRRRYIHLIFDPPTRVRVSTRRLWFIFAPGQGSEPATPASIYAVMSRLAALPHMHLAVAANGIWAFEWTPSPDVHTLRLAPGSPPALAAWTVPGPAGRIVRRGAPASWRVTGNGQSGYVLAQDYWRDPAGKVAARVSIAASGTTNVELWDDGTDTLLDRRVLSRTRSRETVRLDGTVMAASLNAEYAGLGPWRIKPKPPPAGHVLEVRVWSPGGGDRVSVWSVSVTHGVTQ
jgi:uncharacterized membrane protein